MGATENIDSTSAQPRARTEDVALTLLLCSCACPRARARFVGTPREREHGTTDAQERALSACECVDGAVLCVRLSRVV